jgi:Spy/CpxP family protein refolding chaperone
MRKVITTWPLAGILTGVLILSTGTASAEPYERRGGFGLMMRMQERLGLTEDQVKALHQAREQQWEARHHLHRSLTAARRSLNELILQGADVAAITAKTGEIQQLIAQQLAMRVKALQDFASILTPEQRTRLLQRHQRPQGASIELPAAG